MNITWRFHSTLKIKLYTNETMKKYLAIIILCITEFVTVKSQDYTGYTHCAEQDSLALVAFYNATDGPNWKSNSDTFNINNIGSDGDYGLGFWTTYPNAGKGKWLSGPVKDWFGLLLEKQPIGTSKDSAWRLVYITPLLGRRAAGNNNMNGYIPKEVGLLTALRWFRINGNSGLSPCEIPDELYHPTLTELDIESVYVSGIISPAFRKCQNLQLINLRYNYLDSVPTFDFLSSDQLLNYFGSNGLTLFLYSTQISYANWEKSVDYFTTFTTTPTIKYQVQNLSSAGREQEILATPGSTVTLTCNEAGTQGTCTWLKKGTNTYLTGTTYTINNIAAKDTGIYKGSLLNPYIANWQIEANSGVSTVYTKPMHVVFTPVTPTCKYYKTSYSGNEIYLTFSKEMAVPGASQAAGFSVLRNGTTVHVTGISRTGRLSDTYKLTLDSSIFNGDAVTISYTTGTIVDHNGGVLASFSDKTVQNIVRKTPSVIDDAVTRKDGSGIIVNFDQYIDQSTFVASDFTISQSDDASQQVAAITLNAGELDDTISKSITLVLTNTILDSTATIKVGYKKGSLAAFYGAALQTFSPIAVKNVASGKSTSVTLHFDDLCEKYTNIYVKGSIKSLAFKLYDDKTNGDVSADDHNWTRTIRLANGSYTWGIYQRTISAYDTVITTNELTGVQNIVLTPKSGSTTDSLLSKVMTLAISDSIIGNDTIGVIKGDTIAYLCDKSVDFILDMAEYASLNPTKTIEPYLMGINNDWKDGIALSKIKDPLGNDSVFSVTLSGLNTGDALSFSFRNGTDWENNSPETRSHTVVAIDTIRAAFLVTVTSVSTMNNNSISIYPNPVHDQLFISTTDDNTFNVKVYNLFGQIMLTAEEVRSSVNVSHLTDGIYVIELLHKNGNPNRIRFIKK
jgi:uncharacterized repeat protein (TIGR02059 family)